MKSRFSRRCPQQTSVHRRLAGKVSGESSKWSANSQDRWLTSRPGKPYYCVRRGRPTLRPDTGRKPVSTPFEDDSLLPRPVPDMPISPHGRSTILRSERLAWEQRAAVASDAAHHLTGASIALGEVESTNYFGDCIEGDNFFNAFTRALDQLSTQIDENLRTARSLASQCLQASQQISSTDEESALSIEG